MVNEIALKFTVQKTSAHMCTELAGSQTDGRISLI